MRARMCVKGLLVLLGQNNVCRACGMGGMGWDGMGWGGMEWDGMGWDGMGWDGMGWDGMGWDGNADGMGWECRWEWGEQKGMNCPKGTWDELD